NTPTDSASAGNTPTDSASPNTSYTPVVQPLEVNNAPQVEKNESPKGLGGYVKRFAAAYARGTKDSIAEKISNSPHFDTARKIRENSLSDQISKKKE
ncbi:MAG: hypothetical protein Q4A74_06445, partial [Cardiobacteriaceae bacterium]|nr:hypothetical protein [Cardiobacteriaceae bacterium]